MKKRFLSILLTLALLTAALPLSAYADEFDEWYAAAKEDAKSADYIIGASDVRTMGVNTVLFPGETIAIVPDASKQNNQVDGRIGYSIIQLENLTGDYSRLNSGTAQPKPVLTPVAETTVNVPYKIFGGDMTDIHDLADFTYVKLYRNDTGLPLVLCWDELGSQFDGDKRGYAPLGGSGHNVLGSVSYSSGGVLHFLAPSYTIDYADDVQVGWTDTMPFADLYWNNSTHTAPELPASYAMDAKEHTYELPAPILKGAKFEYWLEEPYYYWNPFHFLRLSDPTENAGLYAVHDAQSSRLTLNAAAYISGQTSSAFKYGDDFMPMLNITLSPYFSTAENKTHTIGFNPEGGTVKGLNYYICEDYDYELDVTSVVPVWEGHAFQGWCMDKSNPAATLLTGEPTDYEIEGHTLFDSHTELYAVWQEGGAPKGDVNGDGEVNIMDVIRLLKFVSGWDVGIEKNASDVTGDGEVSIMDVIRLLKYVSGWKVELA